jgi:hypothetical protein
MIGRLPEPGAVIRNLNGRVLQGRPMSLPFLNFMVDISRATACGHERVLRFDDI